MSSAGSIAERSPEPSSGSVRLQMWNRAVSSPNRSPVLVPPRVIPQQLVSPTRQAPVGWGSGPASPPPTAAGCRNLDGAATARTLGSMRPSAGTPFLSHVPQQHWRLGVGPGKASASAPLSPASAASLSPPCSPAPGNTRHRQGPAFLDALLPPEPAVRMGLGAAGDRQPQPPGCPPLPAPGALSQRRGGHARRLSLDGAQEGRRAGFAGASALFPGRPCFRTSQPQNKARFGSQQATDQQTCPQNPGPTSPDTFQSSAGDPAPLPCPEPLGSTAARQLRGNEALISGLLAIGSQSDAAAQSARILAPRGPKGQGQRHASAAGSHRRSQSMPEPELVAGHEAREGRKEAVAAGVFAWAATRRLTGADARGSLQK